MNRCCLLASVLQPLACSFWHRVQNGCKLRRCARFTTSGGSKTTPVAVAANRAKTQAAASASLKTCNLSAQPKTAAAATGLRPEEPVTALAHRRSARKAQIKMEDDSVQAFDDTVDERFYDERRATRSGGSGSATTLCMWRRSGAPSCQPRPTKKTRTMVMGDRTAGCSCAAFTNGSATPTRRRTASGS